MVYKAYPFTSLNMARVQSIKFLHLMTTFFQIQFTISKPVGFSLKLIPRDSPQSPFYTGNLTQPERISSLVELSKARANYLASDSMKPSNIFLPLNRTDLWYSAKISIGQPSKEVTLLVDLASGLTWTQCSPCKKCFPQGTSKYDLRNSKTYEQIPCKHLICRKLYRCINGKCVYKLSYGNGTRSGSTKGVVSLDAFKMPLRDHTSKLFYRVIFGCSNENQGFGFARNTVSGILGLNRSPVSLINQLVTEIQGRFSYCLHAGNSYIRFGDDAVINGSRGVMKRTPFVNPKLPRYHLDLIDLSVGSMRMRFPKGSFSLKNGGCIIDSGAPNSVIARKAYSKVIKAFANYYARKLERINGSSYGLELCYRYKEAFQLYASMTFHFRGADFVVNSRNMHVFNLQEGHLCVALVPGAQTMLGTLQQWGTRFVYDINANVLQFVRENCTEDRG